MSIKKGDNGLHACELQSKKTQAWDVHRDDDDDDDGDDDIVESVLSAYNQSFNTFKA